MRTAVIVIVLFTCIWQTQCRHVGRHHLENGQTLIDYFTNGPGKGQTYNWLAHLCDTFGNRYAPGPQYDVAANYLISQLHEAGADRVWIEMAPGVPNWFRNQDLVVKEQAILLSPRKIEIPILPLGNSTATPPRDGIQEAKVIVVKSFDELKNMSDGQVKGKIVVFNPPWVGGYEEMVNYRAMGATRAAEKGGIAALIRSITPQSLYTLHTGGIYYSNDSELQIPVASITVEDAQLLNRLQDAGHDLVMSLYVNTIYRGTLSKPNVVAEITGSQFPDEMVLFGGHLDSWDVGEGAMDDGGGVAITFQAMKDIKALGLKPKRTIRAVFWAAEEFGYIGAHAYYSNHKNEASKISLVMESDTGTFKPLGFHYAGNKQAQAILQEVMKIGQSLNATILSVNGEEPGDPGAFVENDGVPGVEFITENERYFWYHHSNADTMTLHNTTALDQCSALWAAVAFTVADLDKLLPHGK